MSEPRTPTDRFRERVLALLSYDPESGKLVWRDPSCDADRHWKRVPGAEAGSINPNDGYRYIKLEGRTYAAHRLAFLIMCGALPLAVDHINGVCADNRWLNLRRATPQQNAQNSAPRGASRIKGVTFDEAAGKWRARIRVGDRRRDIFLGHFETPEAASAAYNEAAERHHGAFAYRREA